LAFGPELSLHPVVQCDLTETLASLVIAGAGVAWLPGLLTHTAVDDGLMARVGAGRWDVDLEVRLYRRRDARVSEPVRTVWQRAARLTEDDAARV
jgi:DNA-binding transcriptional LysR family regulator